MEDKIIYGLVGYCLLRELFYLYSVQKLVNKLMSRSYYEYNQAVKFEPQKPQMKFKEEDEVEDLGVLSGIGVI